MLRPTRARMLAAAAALTGAGALAATAAVTMLAAQPGCTSDCNERCGPVSVRVQTAVNADIGIQYLSWRGPACPDTAPGCRGDGFSTFCTHTEIPGAAPGSCELLVVFADRPPEIVRAEFGEAKACCPGYPVIGESEYIIPLAADAGIYGFDAGATDAVTILWDAGADGATDGPADGGTD